MHKENQRLAVRLGEAEAKAQDAADRLQRIEGSVFWKPVRLAGACRKAVKKVGTQRGTHAGKNRAGSDSARQDLSAEPMRFSNGRTYEEELFAQRHPYVQFIKEQRRERHPEEEQEGTQAWRAKMEHPEVEVNGWKKVIIGDTDLCMIACGHGLVHPEEFLRIIAWFRQPEHADCLFAYTDEDYFWEKPENVMHPWYKPDWSPDTLCAYAYTGHMIILRKSWYEGFLGDWGGRKNKSETDFYALCLRLEEVSADKGLRIGHIPEPLFHNRYELNALGQATVTEAKAAGEDTLAVAERFLNADLERGYGIESAGISCHAMRQRMLERRGLSAHLAGSFWPGIYHVVYEIAEPAPLVSVIIPTKDHPALVERCLSSFREKTDYANYEWILVDNGSSPENRKKTEALQAEFGFTYLYEPMEFNFSKMCNLGVAASKGKYLLLLNDDTEVIEGEWLTRLLGQAMQPNVGAVGAQLWYPNGENIQHAGITNLSVGPSHKLVNFIDNKCYYYGRNLLVYDVSAVTGACLMVSREKFLQAGGMDESMPVTYNDVDLCFRLLESGYYNVIRNDVVLVHHESATRGRDEADSEKWERLLAEKERLYEKHPAMRGRDPFYHADLIDDASDYRCNFKSEHEGHFQTQDDVKPYEGKLAAYGKGLLKLTIDRAELQRPILAKEPELYLVSGWSYLQGRDNANCRRTLLFSHENGTLLTAEPYAALRPDVSDFLQGECHIDLAGFEIRIKKENLQAGHWRIGMIAVDEADNSRWIAWSDKCLDIK